jgi:hypothetical protein
VRLSLVFAAAVFVSGAFAAGPFYLGAWKIGSAVVAPWWDSPGKPDPAGVKEFVGKTVTIKVGEIVAPGLLACQGPKYKVRDSPAEGLFQGAFDEMRRRDKSVDPAQVAATLGFRGTSWKTLETGCANELDYHFVDPNTVEFGLNNYVYFLKKQ